MSHEGKWGEKGSYTHVSVCSNCHASNTFSIPKGVRIDTFLTKQHCFKCGCSIVEDNSPKWKHHEKGWMAINGKKVR